MRGLVLMFLLTICRIADSQVIVNGININELTEKYVKVIGVNRIEKSRLIFDHAVIDYGQKLSVDAIQKIKDADGNLQSFKSITEATIFMTRNGWDFVKAYSESNDDDHLLRPVRHYLFKKKK
jgi:hypothetical protein